MPTVIIYASATSSTSCTIRPVNINEVGSFTFFSFDLMFWFSIYINQALMFVVILSKSTLFLLDLELIFEEIQIFP